MGLLDARQAAGNMPTASTVIEIAKVTPAKTALREAPYKAALEALLRKPPSQFPGRMQKLTRQPNDLVEACSRYRGQLVAGVHFHPVVAAVHLAFNDHRPLVLSPDILWLLVIQGLANHVNANAEELRHRLVEHSGTATIVVRRDDFHKGSPENPWPEVFDEFTTQIRAHVGETTHDLVLPAFSTTGVAERAAAQIVLLDAMQSYFSYEFRTMCGIPQVVLEGTADDWEKLAERTRNLEGFGLKWWTSALAPVLDEFVAAARGRVNVRFWQAIYKVDGGSGGPYTTGWITAFFPYLKDRQTRRATNRNPWLTRGGKKLQEMLYPPEKSDPYGSGHGPTTEQFPSGLSRAPFLWKYVIRFYEMEFLGGFVGICQDPKTLGLRPEIGWAVRDLAGVRALEAAEAAEAAAAAKQREAWTQAETERLTMCSYCKGSGNCFCKRKGASLPKQCARCAGSGKCHVCKGTGNQR
jgi:hypothetical protein